jgi:hypothetical protein
MKMLCEILLNSPQRSIIARFYLECAFWAIIFISHSAIIVKMYDVKLENHEYEHLIFVATFFAIIYYAKDFISLVLQPALGYSW